MTEDSHYVGAPQAEGYKSMKALQGGRMKDADREAFVCTLTLPDETQAHIQGGLVDVQIQ